MNRLKPVELILACSFFISGAAALIYQISWNRALYGAIGVDMDSVTIIVSCFMLGIGLGGALGGWLADRYPQRKVRMYALTELSLCIYGMMSLSVISTVSAWTLLPGVMGLVLTAVAAFTALLVPTVLMGMTLPILSLAFQEKTGNLGGAVGRLYFANTLGAAVGAYAVPFYLFHHLNLQEASWLAAGLNALVASMTVLALYMTTAKKEQAL